MRNFFVFGTRPSSDFGVYISGTGTFGSPQRMYDLLTVPGKSGSLAVSKRRLDDVVVTYPSFIQNGFKGNLAALRGYLLGELNIGWQRLTDTYNPNEFRLALYTGALAPTVTRRLDAGSFDITFRCKPQRYLVSGETAISINGQMTVTNPGTCPAKPLIEVSAAGEVSLGDSVITIADGAAFPLFIDCESMTIYDSNEARQSGLVSMTSLDFPELPAGESNIESTVAIKVTPRWYVL